MVSDTCFDISRHESNLTPKFLTVTAGTSPLPRISAGKKGAIVQLAVFVPENNHIIDKHSHVIYKMLNNCLI